MRTNYKLQETKVLELMWFQSTNRKSLESGITIGITISLITIGLKL